MTFYAFAEGSTEEKVLDAIKKVMNLKMDISAGQGKGQINPKMAAKLAPKLRNGDSIRCLVMRDLDTHTGETIERIVQSVQDTVNRMLRERVSEAPVVTLSALPDFPSVYTLELTKPDFRLALHIATNRWHEGFDKATIDDYVLSLALQPTTAKALVDKKGWTISAEDLLRKVTTEIPGLLEGNGIPLREAKDYVRLYAAVVQEHTSPPVFAQRTLAHASEGDLKRVFAPLLAAIEFLIRS